MSRKAVKREKPLPLPLPEQQYIAFWRPTDPNAYLGQWYRSVFTLTQDICDQLPNEIKNLPLYKDRLDVLNMMMGINYVNAEKFMMMGKAALFGDNHIFRLMNNTDFPKEHKSLGRHVNNFNDDTWDTYCCDIVTIANYLKFSQNEELRNLLINTGNAILIEGSPLDKIWGVGLRFDHPDIQNADRWKGTNYLGQCLMFVRQLI